MASSHKIDVEKERENLVRASALLDDIHFPRPKSFANPLLECCEIDWVRPTDMADDPQVYDFDTVKNDLISIYRGDPSFDWFMVPLAHMCAYPPLVYNLLPAKEDFSKKSGGMYKVRLHDLGHWVEVIIDDRLPVHSARPEHFAESELYFVPSTTGYWLPLIVKAYAKLHGSYEKLTSGTIAEAYSDFTSGVTETYIMKELPPKFHTALVKFYETACLMNAEYVDYEDDGQQHVSHWIVTEIKRKGFEEDAKPNDITLKLRYVFSLSEGKSVCEIIKSCHLMRLLIDLNSRDNAEGAFWITYKDFVRSFHTLYVCTLDVSLAVFVREPVVKMTSYRFHGKWSTMLSTPHSLYDPTSIPFWYYQQFKFELREQDMYRNDKRCEFLVSLQQPGHMYNPSIAMIGVFIFRLVKENITLPVPPKFFTMYRHVTQLIQHGRLIQQRMKLPVGSYLIVPVAEPDNHNDFFLIVMTEARYKVWGHVPRSGRFASITSNISQAMSKRTSKHSQIKRISQEPSKTPSPSDLRIYSIQKSN